MAGLDPAIFSNADNAEKDARLKAGHDELVTLARLRERVLAEGGG